MVKDRSETNGKDGYRRAKEIPLKHGKPVEVLKKRLISKRL